MEQTHNWVYHTPSQATWTPPQTRGIKRTISESDCEDAYSETSSKDQYVSNKNTSPGDSDSCQLLSRKKRRGVIEKKRRDKINSSLSELKRLVPAAYEKQGSAKLEKAEILQLTVDHLKALHAKGEGFPYDHQRYVLDYHLSGFRECISEIARYLAAIEGMDLQDPLRLRIMSHLQCFLTQKELAARANTTGFQTYPTAPPPFPIYHQQNYSHPHHQGQTFMHQVSTHTSEHPVTQADSTTASPHAPPTYTTRSVSAASVAATASLQLHSTQQHMPNTNYSVSESTHVDQNQGTTYLDLTHSNGRALQPYPMVPFSAGSDVYSTNANFNNNSSKPYRPWGAEMAY